jgi:hypothetical protein
MIWTSERIYRGGHLALGMGLGDVGDLLSYRQMWEPFIQAHLELWRDLNERLESIPEASKCPAGIFAASQIDASLPETVRSFCASLSVSRMMISATDPRGIQTQWNAWKDKSSADMLVGADQMLKWHQDVVLRVGGTYKTDLVGISKLWGLEVTLPPVPSFSTQQEIIARIEGAYVATKGVLQLIGYGSGEALMLAPNAVTAAAEGLTETAREIRETVSKPVVWIGVAAVVAVVGGVLYVYYNPRKSEPAYA